MGELDKCPPNFFVPEKEGPWTCLEITATALNQGRKKKVEAAEVFGQMYAEDSDGGPADGLPQGKEEAGHLYRGGAVPLAASFPLRRRQGNLSERRDREDLRKVRPVRGRLEQVRRFPRPARQRQSPPGREGQQLQAIGKALRGVYKAERDCTFFLDSRKGKLESQN